MKAKTGLRKKILGAALIEAALVIVPFLILTVGGVEYLWYLHIKQNLTTAAEDGVRVAAMDHNELGGAGLGQSEQSLAPLQPIAQAAVTGSLLGMGYSLDFVSKVSVTLDYLQFLDKIDPRLTTTGFSQYKKLRLIGAVVTLPWEKAMIFGDITAKLLHLTGNSPPELRIIVLMWKPWKEINGQNNEAQQ